MAKKRKKFPAADGGAKGPALREAAAPTRDEPGKAPEKDDKRPDSPLKAGMDFILVLAGAIAIALVIKAYVFDVYLIPSGSMETALHGRPDGGDRIFCSKLSYRFRPIKRWEVAVFEFPYEAAKRSDADYEVEQYRGQNFVKRMVGLPGETLAIAKGDVWAKRDGEREYARLVKPDTVQSGMWLNVYEECFSDLRENELPEFWRVNGEVELPRGGPLTLLPGDGETTLDYRPRVPAGRRKENLPELPGIPDRYTLRQPVQFRCPATKGNGEPCGAIFVKTIKTHNAAARCPECGTLAPETAAVFYHRRSGLPLEGRYAVNPMYARQGEDSYRQYDYRIVPDLRTVLDAALSRNDSWLGVRLSEDNRNVEARFNADGRIELRVNGAPSLPEHRALADLAPGRRERLEFYVADGRARVFVGESRKLFLDVQIWDDRRPSPRSLPRSSGVRLSAGGSGASLYSVKIDRDVFYYSGWERYEDDKFDQIGSQGEIYINNESFFPMGDHCVSSYDARSWGPVPLNHLRGPALFVWWPPDRLGVIPRPE